MTRRGRRDSEYWEEPEEEYYENEYDEEDGEYDEEEEEYYEPRPQPRRRRRARPRKRRIWPTLLMGCGLGIFLVVLAAAAVVFFAIRSIPGVGSQNGLGGLGTINNGTAYTQTIPIAPIQLNTLTQIQICDKIGNVTLTTSSDPNANTITVTATKVVQTSSQSQANQEFQRLSVETQPPTTLTTTPTCTAQTAVPTATTGQGTSNSTLTINAIMPDVSNMLHGASDSINIAVTLPSNLVQQAGPGLSVLINAPLGNITMDNVSGNLQVKASSGNIKISHAVIEIGSHIETGQGNITFSGVLGQSSTANGQTARYLFQCEQGNIDLTLPTTTNVTVDANTNVGTIGGDFHLAVQNSNGITTYNGPLSSTAGTPPANLLLVTDVSTGNITFHALQSS